MNAPLRPTPADVVNHTMRHANGAPRQTPGLRLVATWTDLACGCSESDGGSWIVTTACPEHMELLSEEDRQTLGSETKGSRGWRGVGVLFGPFKPDVEAPRAGTEAGEVPSGTLVAGSPAASTYDNRTPATAGI